MSLLSRFSQVVDWRLAILCFMSKSHLWVIYTLFVFLGMVASLSMFVPSSVHLFENFKMSLFLPLSSTPLCKCTAFFLVHSLLEGHLGCFQVLNMTNNAAMNIAEQIFFPCGMTEHP